ncbi:hypothetical protein [Burkholderia latens]|uniref:hypothetical protein n=1 Tax=Burkholderia latens TaxID=488446 RepID=UPI00158A5010|nr:hypothetical protein [Burkholderia latens]
MFRALLDYFWPPPPKEVSRESAAALKADIKAAGVWGKPLEDVNRDTVDVWVRRSDRQSRAENVQWLKPRARLFALRWAVLSGVLWVGAWMASACLVAEVPLTLAAFGSSVVAITFFWIARAFNK